MRVINEAFKGCLQILKKYQLLYKYSKGEYLVEVGSIFWSYYLYEGFEVDPRKTKEVKFCLDLWLLRTLGVS